MFRVKSILVFRNKSTLTKSPIIERVKEIENVWVKKYSCRKRKIDPNQKPFYVLSMFPYPSGNLHMGHLKVYTVADTISRFFQLKGLQTFLPLGWDSFGLPAENAAIDHNVNPAEWTQNNIQKMKSQLEKDMFLGVDWSCEISTSDPNYYKWTQWLFLQLMKKGLAYRKSAYVNWDPVDETVLADELVDENGCSWRSGAKVVKKSMHQWYFATTSLSESLLKGLSEIDNKDWNDVVNLQKGWIGTPNGTLLRLPVYNSLSEKKEDTVDCFITDMAEFALCRMPFFLISKMNSLNDEHRAFTSAVELRGSRKLVLHRDLVQGEGERASNSLSLQSYEMAKPWDELLNLYILHPITQEKIPIVVSTFPINRPEEADHARPGNPNECLNANRIAKQFGFNSFKPLLYSDGTLNCPENPNIHGLSKEAVEEKYCEMLKASGIGGYKSSSLRKDWLISRQRYWGTPIPIVYCDSCGTVPVPEEDLPVVLPHFTGKIERGTSILKSHSSWINTTCPKCQGPAKRETDTMDTFVDSSWYYIRYLDPNNSERIIDGEIARQRLPVDLYIGGLEHAIKHLFYARFISHFLHQIGLLPEAEPFKKFLPIGQVMGETYKGSRTGRYYRKGQVVKKDNKYHAMDEPVNIYFDKMSKSKLNGVEPRDVVNDLGLDITRLMILSNTGPQKSRKWTSDGPVLRGIENWISKLFFLTRPIDQPMTCEGPIQLTDAQMGGIKDLALVHKRTLEQVNELFENSFMLNVTISRLQELTESLRKTYHLLKPYDVILIPEYMLALSNLIVMLHPLAPLLSAQLWQDFRSMIDNYNASQHRDRYSATVERLNESHRMNSDIWDQTIMEGNKERK